MKILLLSDTHGYLDPTLRDHAQPCDEIWHAGDVGNNQVLDALKEVKPVRAVFGNIDDHTLRSKLPLDLWFECEELTVWITHIGGTPKHYESRVKKLLLEKSPDIFVCGHSHILRVQRDKNHSNMLYMNPGAAGNQGFHVTRTVLRFEISGKQIKNPEVIEFGRRGALD